MQASWLLSHQVDRVAVAAPAAAAGAAAGGAAAEEEKEEKRKRVCFLNPEQSYAIWFSG